MPEPLDDALAEVRALLLDQHNLVRAVAAGRRRNQVPRWQRAQFRPVMIKSTPRLQRVTDDGARPYTRNAAWGEPAARLVDEVLTQPFGNWHIETIGQTVQLRVTKRGEAQVHRESRRTGLAPARPAPHDRTRTHLIDPGDPLFTVLGASAAKRRQVDAFLRALAATLDDDPLPSPLRVVDLGCGNAYLSFAAHRYLTQRRGLVVDLTGVDVREDQRTRNTEIAMRLDCADRVRFVADTVADVDLPGADVVLALHACDTATDEALARAVGWRARWILAAPCCHHDVAAQLRRHSAPAPYAPLVRSGILRERFADVLTDALRASVLRLHGYHVDVVEFIESAHTPRNVLLRARTGAGSPGPDQYQDYADLLRAWQITPALSRLLPPPASPPQEPPLPTSPPPLASAQVPAPADGPAGPPGATHEASW